jgi:hypothetical protein
MITPFDLENFGKTAALAYISDGTSMNSSILKTAADNNLNLQQVHRVVETANVDAYLNLIKASSDKYVDFPLANAKTIYTELTTDSGVNKSETNMDYENPPVKTASVNLFPGVTQEGIDKVAEVAPPSYMALRKEASKIEGICNYISDEATNTQREFMLNYNKV